MIGRRHHEELPVPVIGEATERPLPAGPPRWVVPVQCPNCGARIDQALEASAAEPRCSFCHEPLPVQPIQAVVPNPATDLAGALGTILSQALGGSAVGGGAMVIDTKAHLSQDGIAGQATIIGVRELAAIGDNHALELQLQVELPDRSPYMAITKAVVSPSVAATEAVEGARCAVKVDPTNDHTVLIEWA